jgi:hypothetical protein
MLGAPDCKAKLLIGADPLSQKSGDVIGQSLAFIPFLVAEPGPVSASREFVTRIHVAPTISVVESRHLVYLKASFPER